ncbi:MAG: hypothetical protein EOS10_11610 [Mesorhizobium sp.]|uniref:hypothetical protein n=1 Tax=Mesorhizobium sp. TaxID=1871066 RepID=UPI000FEA3F57|nr:hypothetical protein [Mesorhizobium sp.]RWO32338.1 MAG: hypothetical protein EOS10_11610 [Mesorhizobium sp.]
MEQTDQQGVGGQDETPVDLFLGTVLHGASPFKLGKVNDSFLRSGPVRRWRDPTANHQRFERAPARKRDNASYNRPGVEIAHTYANSRASRAGNFDGFALPTG